MASINFKCNSLMPLHFKGLRPIFVAGHLKVQISTETYKNLLNSCIC